MTFILQDEKFTKIRSCIKLNAAFTHSYYANFSDAKKFQTDKFPDVQYLES